MNKLQELTNLCKASVTVSMNDHLSFYQTPIQYLKQGCEDRTKETSAEILHEIERTGQLVEVQFYPLTPNGFYQVVHFDIEKALTEALEIMKKESK